MNDMLFSYRFGCRILLPRVLQRKTVPPIQQMGGHSTPGLRRSCLLNLKAARRAEPFIARHVSGSANAEVRSDGVDEVWMLMIEMELRV